ncbi:serine/threonine protein phosphatase [Amycolatopsis thailandensis]|uniref:Serine/threonine protein phosphatase n=1 Tax=Amycolatopsis thailandensis TaxID=589330 RepID=A0A229R858_9PSEU|nr:protein phosphatase 2C domain-containing protein [Amycolatopsis thailandensis]OXM42775.1 serine/threonine protein phosphatase [Amycolatopsis thailandensis]
MLHVLRDTTGRALHKVATVQPRPDEPPRALCGLCGWSETADPPGDHTEARSLAREHLHRPAEWPVFHRGRASLTGGRRVNADHSAVLVDDACGEVTAWAVADGIGDTPEAAHAARVAASTAVRALYGSRLAPADAILAARDELTRRAPDGDAVMIVAAARAGGDGYELAWVGDCRGYELRDGHLIQLTTDHTVAEETRAWLREAYSQHEEPPGWYAHHLPRWEHIVTTTVATATTADIGRATTGDQTTRLLLTTDGVHKQVPHDTLATLVSTASSVRAGAHRIARAGIEHGGQDNATALLVDPVVVP